uniref:Abundant larval transcript-2 protein n=1 Tax=Loa loa TaxID=7209 RepID=A0A1I7VS80_LOALO
MNKLLIAFGLVFLLVLLPCESQSDEHFDNDGDSGGDEEDDDADYEADSNGDEGDDGDDDDDEEDDDDADEGDDGDGDEEDDGNDDGEDDGGEGDGAYVTKGEFVETDGKKKECKSHEACYDQREPQDWCRLNENQSWTDKGCYCDDKLHSCIIERKNGDKLEYAHCAPEQGWKCPSK